MAEKRPSNDVARMYVNPLIRHKILHEPKRIVGRTVCNDPVNTGIERELGGYTIYFSDDTPFAVDRGDGWQCLPHMILIRPYQKHRIRRCEGLRTIVLEPESVCPDFMEEDRWVEGTRANKDWQARIEEGFDTWERLGYVPDRTIDELVFGQTLPPRHLDSRIADIVQRICECPYGERSSVKTLAQFMDLSESRLSHLFSEQLDISIRSFRSWKRMRNSIALAVHKPILLHVALDAGYADEPHYCRATWKYFGQRANLLRRHWRQFAVFRDQDCRQA